MKEILYCIDKCNNIVWSGDWKNLIEKILCCADKYNSLVTIFLTVVATYIAARQFFETKFHKIEVIFPYNEIYGNEIFIPYIYIFNKKNKVEIITEIMLKIGSNCVLLLKTFEEPIVLNSMEMKKINLDKVSFYGFGTKIISNMSEIINNSKIKKSIILNTPYGSINTKSLKHIPENLYIDMSFKNKITPIYLREWLDKDGDVINYQTKYIGKIYRDDKILEKFYVFKNGLIKNIFFDKYFLSNSVNLKTINSLKETKDFLLNIFKFNSDIKYRIDLYEYEYKQHLEAETTELNVINSRIKFLLIKIFLYFIEKLNK